MDRRPARKRGSRISRRIISDNSARSVSCSRCFWLRHNSISRSEEISHRRFFSLEYFRSVLSKFHARIGLYVIDYLAQHLIRQRPIGGDDNRGNFRALPFILCARFRYRYVKLVSQVRQQAAQYLPFVLRDSLSDIINSACRDVSPYYTKESAPTRYPMRPLPTLLVTTM